MKHYQCRRAIVTGGGSGIGQATVRRMLQEGGNVDAIDASAAGLAETVLK